MVDRIVREQARSNKRVTLVTAQVMLVFVSLFVLMFVFVFVFFVLFFIFLPFMCFFGTVDFV